MSSVVAGRKCFHRRVSFLLSTRGWGRCILACNGAGGVYPSMQLGGDVCVEGVVPTQDGMSTQEGCLPRGVSTIQTPGHYPSMQWGCLPRGGVCPGGMYSREVSTTHTPLPRASPPKRPLKRAVRIVLECILV